MPNRGQEEHDGREALLSLEDVTMRVRDRKLLAHTNWTIRGGEQWAVLGPNGSGKSTLARTAAGEIPSASGHVHIRAGERVSMVSFERQQELYTRELELDHARHFADTVDDVLTPRKLLGSHGRREGRETAAHGLEIAHLLDRPFRHLSAGEMRKALIVRALASAPSLLFLDEPFDGLDRGSRDSLSGYLERIMADGCHVILVTHRADEILSSVTHVLALRDGEVVGMGTKEEMLDGARLETLYGAPLQRARKRSSPSTGGGTSGSAESIVELSGVTVRYGDHVVVRSLDWRLMRGERWGIFGPNGSGKTTILDLIIGDNLQGYANDVRVFGVKRGGGESIWELKRRIGVVTPGLQLGYRHSITALEVVVSGFFDSVGLYRRPSEGELEAARRWIETLEIGDLADRHFTRLSYGQRRLVLIARAMVKDPELLVLDEPCQGLDPRNRHRVLDAIDTACETSHTSLLYVTHHDDEHPHCLTHALHLSGPGEPATQEAYRG